MAVRFTADTRFYFSAASQMYFVKAGDVFAGDMAVWVTDNLNSACFEIVDDPKPGPDLTVAAVHVPELGQFLGDADPAGDSADDGPADFDPAQHTADQVLTFVADHPDLRETVRQAELGGRARSVLLSKLA